MPAANEAAEIYIVAKTKGVKESTLDLAALGKESKKTAGDVSKLSNAAEGLNVFGLVGKSFKSLQKNLSDISKNYKEATKAVNGYTSALMKNAKAQQAALGEQDKVIKQVNRERERAKTFIGANTRGGAQSNRFVSSNILAQIQDIAVTSAMNMNPLLIAMQQGTQLQYILANSNAPLKDFVAGLKSAFNASGMLAIGLTGLVAVGIQMVDWVSVGKTGLNGLADVFEFVAENADTFAIAMAAAGVALVAFNAGAIVSTIGNLAKLGATAVVAGAKMAAAWIMGMGPLGWVLTGIAAITTAVLAFGDKLRKVFGDDFIDTVKFAINKTIGLFAVAFNSIIKGAAWVWEKLKSIVGGEGPAKSLMDTLAESNSKVWNKDFIGDATTGIRAGATAVAEKLRDWSTHLGESEKKTKKIRDYWKDINLSAQQKIDDLVMKRNLLGAGTYKSTYIQTLADLKQQAEGHGIELTPDKISQLEKLAEVTAKETYETERLTEAYKEGKSVFKGFFTDMRQGLLDGESAWVSFGNAVLNVLNKIQEKLLDKSTDILFDSLWTMGKTYFGASSSSGTTSGAPYATSATSSFDYRMSSLGYAKGGVFANSIYDSPTMFRFAKGARFGVMGEAGPEAVIPLQRGPDGSLGVKADGVGGAPVIVNVINNSNAQARTEQRQTSQGMEVDVIIDEMVAQKMGKNGTASNSALKAFSNQSLVMR